MSKTNKWGSVYVLLSVNAAAKKNIFIWNNVSRFIMCLIILCVLLVVSEVIFLSSQSNWDWFQLSGQLIPLLPAHCCLRLLGFHSCCLHQDWDCCWNYTTYIFLRDWIQKKRKIVWGCLERWSCPWCWILSPGKHLSYTLPAWITQSGPSSWKIFMFVDTNHQTWEIVFRDMKSKRENMLTLESENRRALN